MEKKFTIGIIIPLYNAGDYISDCLNSILQQTFQNYLVRIVDDGSKDHSPDICKSYAAKHSDKILYERIPNGGANSARNKALKESNEDLIIFVDQDDFFADKNSLSIINQHFSENPSDEFLIYKYREFFTKIKKNKNRPDFGKNAINGEDTYNKLKSFVVNGNVPISPWDKAFKRDFLINNNIYLPVGFAAGDINWFIEIINKTIKFSVINEIIYVYRRQVSTSMTNNFSLKKFEDLLSIVEHESDLIQKADKDHYAALFYSFLAYELCILLSLTSHMNKMEYLRYKERLEALHWLFKYDLNPKVRKVNMARSVFGNKATALLLRMYIKFYVNKN